MIEKKTNTGPPLISIILVCLNSEITIEQTLQSIVHLDYPNIELVVVDGASSDKTLGIINKYNYLINKLISEKDSGIYEAMNKGIKYAKGDYLYFIGSDDIIINSWSNLIGKLKLQNTVYYGNVYFPLTNKIYDGKINFLRLLTKNISHQAIFYPKSVFEKYHYSIEYPLLGDFYLNLLLNSDPYFRFKYINVLIAIFSEKGISNFTKDKKFQEVYLKIVKKNYPIFLYWYAFTVKTIEKWIVNRKRFI